MKEYQRKFIKFMIEADVLQFKDHKLKSGRLSPYFFNAGGFNTGNALLQLSKFYADALVDSGMEYDVLFGPAYKGIPLVTATAIALSSEHNLNPPFCFNRKEAKEHGEGGNLVGHPLVGRILVVDDVITAGTAIRESVEIIKRAGAKLCGVLIALDRQEVGIDGTGKSAVQQVQDDLDVKVVSIVGLGHVIEYLRQSGEYQDKIDKVVDYRNLYGIQ